MNTPEIKFEEDQFSMSPVVVPKNPTFSLIALVQRWGLARDERSANFVLVVALFFIIATTFGIVVLSGGGAGTLTSAQKDQLQQVEAAMRAKGLIR